MITDGERSVMTWCGDYQWKAVPSSHGDAPSMPLLTYVVHLMLSVSQISAEVHSCVASLAHCNVGEQDDFDVYIRLISLSSDRPIKDHHATLHWLGCGCCPSPPVKKVIRLKMFSVAFEPQVCVWWPDYWQGQQNLHLGSSVSLVNSECQWVHQWRL